MAGRETKYGPNRRKGARSQEAGRPEAMGELEEEPTPSPSPSPSRRLVSIAFSVALAAVIVTTGLQMSGTGSRTATTTSSPPPAAPATTRLAVCAAVRDSPGNIIEWIDYHRAPAIGVDKFYLMVTDDPDVAVLEEALGPLIAGSVVELYDLQHVNPTTVSQLQVNLYARCLDAVRDKHDFVGFWDVDECVSICLSIYPSVSSEAGVLNLSRPSTDCASPTYPPARSLARSHSIAHKLSPGSSCPAPTKRTRSGSSSAIRT